MTQTVEATAPSPHPKWTFPISAWNEEPIGHEWSYRHSDSANTELDAMRISPDVLDRCS